MTGPASIAGVILAGGRGRRMGARDKGWVEFQGRPLIEHVLDRFAPQVGQVIVSANRNNERYAALGVRVVADVLADYQGPLAGLQVALRATDTPMLACVPCDSPFLPLDLVARLRQALQESAAQLAFARVAGCIHPVFCLCERTVQPSVEAALASGERRLETWCRSLKAVEVDFEDPDAFRNINTPNDLCPSNRP